VRCYGASMRYDGPLTMRRHAAMFWPLYLLLVILVVCAIPLFGLEPRGALIISFLSGASLGVGLALLQIHWSRQS
jgi:hypothetical protein